MGMNKLSKWGWAAWDRARRIAARLRVVNAEPYSDRFNRTFLVFWTISTAMAGVNLAMNAMMVTSLTPLWLVINLLTAAFDFRMLTWCIEGFFYRKDVKRREAELDRFMTVVMQGYGVEGK
jgi:hypothetical protein